MRDTTTTQRAPATTRVASQNQASSTLVQTLRKTEGYAAQLQLLSPEADEAAPGPDVLLSANPSPAVAVDLRGRAEWLMARWGQALPADALRTTPAGTTLRWSPTWGPRPVMSPMPKSLTPIDASLALGWLRGLATWSEAGAAERARFEAIVGGEVNDRSILARDAIVAKRAEITGAADGAALSKVLGGITEAGENYPLVMAEPIREPTQGTYVIEKVEELAEYDFQVDKYRRPTKATRYVVRYRSKDGRPAGEFEAVDHHPEDPIVSAVAKKSPTYMTVARLAELGLLLPDADRTAVVRVELAANGGKEAAGYVANDIVVIAPLMAAKAQGLGEDKGELLDQVVLHEAGHQAATGKAGWGNSEAAKATTAGDGSGFGRWRDAIEADGTFISSYARDTVAGTESGTIGGESNDKLSDTKDTAAPVGSNVHEDFAETYSAYFGFTDAFFKDYQAMVPNRFALLRAEFEGSGPKRPEPKSK